MKTKNIFKQRLLGFLSFALTATFPVALLAEQTWAVYYSHNGTFNVRLPINTTTKIHQLVLQDKMAVRLEEVSGVIDYRPYKDITTKYAVKVDYTLGPAVSQEEADTLLTKEARNLADYYRSQDGVVQRELKNKFYGYPGGEILFLFNTKDKGIQGVLVRTIYTESLRIQLIVAGNESSLSSYSTTDFLDSLSFNDGVPLVEDTMKKSWKNIESPSGMFTMLYPARKAPPYYTDAPVAAWDDPNKTETVKVSFYDPIRGEKLFLNLYGYQLGANLTFDDVRDILVKKHIMNYRSNASDVKFSKGVGDEKGAEGTRDFPFVSTTLRIKQPKGYPYLHYMKLNAFFAENKLFVMETLGSHKMLNSYLENSFKDIVSFQPKKVHAFTKPDISSLEAELPVKEGPDAVSIPVAERIERERLRHILKNKNETDEKKSITPDEDKGTVKHNDTHTEKVTPPEKKKDPNEIEVIADEPAKPATP